MDDFNRVQFISPDAQRRYHARVTARVFEEMMAARKPSAFQAKEKEYDAIVRECARLYGGPA